jgi:uncharacterized protein YciI
MLFVIHAMDKKDAINTRAKHYKAHRQHLDASEKYGVGVITAGPFVADDNETPIGSLFIIEAKDRAAVKAFVESDPYHTNGVWEAGGVEIHAYHKKRG